ncbi:MAG: hypothetical protein KGR26_15945, partial [Cyanobacteria bacterium REEB65]|nr:hypothetical protein [Cyanobacteria bacterium REEB65]
LPEAQRPDVPSAFLLDFPAVEPQWVDSALADRWQAILGVRDQVNKALEEARQRKEIGSAVDALVIVPQAIASAVSGTSDPASLLREAFNVSQVRLEGTQITVMAAPGSKCERCWLVVPQVGSDAAHPSLCDRCARAVGNQPVAAG